MGNTLVARTLAGITLLMILATGLASAQTWTAAPSYPGNGAGAAFLLTDGTVMVHQEQTSDDQWYKLTPDINGSYATGTWTHMASIPSGFNYSPLFFGTAVLPDGRMVVEGGEYNFLNAEWTPQGAIYDPQTNTWTQVNPPSGWSTIGDAQSIILNDGTYMQANCCDVKWANFNPTNLTWTPFTGNGKFDVFDEEGFTKLPNGKILAVDAYVFQYNPTGMNSELYDPSTHTWSSAGSTQVQIWDSGCGNQGGASFEEGPVMLLPNGTVFATGATNGCASGHTAIYNTANNTWTAGPDFPRRDYSMADAPGAVEINGKALLMTGIFFNPPAHFYEWDGTNITATADPPNAPNDGAFYGHLLVLPTGQVMLTDYSNDVELYNSAGTFQQSWAPVVIASSNVVKHGVSNYKLYGLRFAGMTQGGYYGDDYSPNTDFALVRITNNATHHVFYCRTHNPSSYALQSSQIQSTQFDVPAGIETGASKLEVVTNGIPSNGLAITVF